MITVSHDIFPGERHDLEKILRSSGFFYDFEIEVALSIADETFIKGQEKSGYFWIKLLDGDKVIGFSNFGLNPSSIHSYDLYWIAVLEEYRKNHLGTLILKSSEERIRELGGKIVWIETSGRPLYEPTRHFYLKNGYELEATLRDFYGPEDSKLVYRKVL